MTIIKYRFLGCGTTIFREHDVGNRILWKDFVHLYQITWHHIQEHSILQAEK